MHGVPDLVISDNGPQFASELFQHFATIYGLTHERYQFPKVSKGQWTGGMSSRTVKEILKKNEDPYLGLLSYRSTPIQLSSSL